MTSPHVHDGLAPVAAAKRLGVTTRTIYRWVATGQLPATKQGPKLLVIPKAAVDELAGSKPETPEEIRAKAAAAVAAAAPNLTPSDLLVLARLLNGDITQDGAA